MFESQKITDETRAAQPGSSVQLGAGSVYYELAGPESGELVVLIHGMSIPSFVWDPTWEPLVKEGFRVLRYDLYGRGYSDRPKARHNAGLYVHQLSELLAALNLGGRPLNLVGFSLGAAIAASFAVEQMDRVRSIIFIDPVHPLDMPPAPSRIWQKVLKIKYFAASLDQSVIVSLPANFNRYEDFPKFEEQFSEQLQYKGFAAALSSTLVDFDYTALPEIYTQVGQSGIPVALFWGEEDQQADFATSAEFKKLIPGIEFHAIEQAGHLSHYERPDLVNPILLSFLTR